MVESAELCEVIRRRIFLQNPLEQSRSGCVQIQGDLLQCGNRKIDLSAFNVAHVDAIQAASVGKRFLRKVFLFTEFSDSSPKLLLSLLHPEDSGSILCLRPHVITEQVITDRVKCPEPQAGLVGHRDCQNPNPLVIRQCQRFCVWRKIDWIREQVRIGIGSKVPSADL